MKVKCVDDRKHIGLIKDKIYTVISIFNNYNNECYVNILGLTNEINLKSNCLVNLDGTNIDRTDYYNHIFQDNTIQRGDLVRYNKKSSKKLKYGKVYTVKYSPYNRKVSLEEVFTLSKGGVRIHPSYSIHSFDRLDEDEIRDIKLNQILEDKDERISNYDKPYIENFEKLTIVLDEIKRARQYLKETCIKDTSIMEVIERRNRDKKLVSPKDFEILEDINWNELLYSI